jgi:hypothetical protein
MTRPSQQTISQSGSQIPKIQRRLAYIAFLDSNSQCVASELAPVTDEAVFGAGAEGRRRRAIELIRVCTRVPGRMVAAGTVLAEV